MNCNFPSGLKVSQIILQHEMFYIIMFCYAWFYGPVKLSECLKCELPRFSYFNNSLCQS